MLKNEFRLKKNKDFRVVYRKGKAYFSPSIVMYTFQNNLENSRIGITVSKKVGKAVIRNRVKRKIREICRLNLHKIKNGYDIIFVARNAILNKNYHQINDEAKRLFKKAKVIIGE